VKFENGLDKFIGETEVIIRERLKINFETPLR